MYACPHGHSIGLELCSTFTVWLPINPATGETGEPNGRERARRACKELRRARNQWFRQYSCTDCTSPVQQRKRSVMSRPCLRQS
jgi:hypothetical protein